MYVTKILTITTLMLTFHPVFAEGNYGGSFVMHLISIGAIFFTLCLIAAIIFLATSKSIGPHTSVESAIEEIHSFQGSAENFKLIISDEINDQLGLNMAIVTNSILEKGFEPNGFVKKGGSKVYYYK